MKGVNVVKLLLCLLISLSTVTAWAAPPEHAKGSPPTKSYWLDVFGEAWEATFPYASCDGFETEITIVISGFWITHTNHPKRDVFEFYHSAWATRISNVSDPSIFVDGVPGQTMNRHWPQESFTGDAIETGVQLMITVPGYGAVLRDVGRIVYGWNSGEVKFTAGEWDTVDGDFQAICEVLSG